MSFTFEAGPIRPPSEAKSILLRVTRNCPWNKCDFCNVYKDKKFSKRSVEDVKNDIDSMFSIAERIIEASNNSGYDGTITDDVINKAIGMDITPENYYYYVANWLNFGLRTAFLQDANSIVYKTSDLVDILRYLKEKFPTIERITSYARSKTVSKKTLEELKDLHNAGLTRIHIGMESGSDDVLAFVKKGVTSHEHILAGQKAIEAGFDLSEYYMPGLGGRELSDKNALESARVISSINPTFIRIRSTIAVPGTLLHQAMTENRWTALTEEDKVRELRLFIEKLQGIDSTLVSDHMMNLLEDVEGKLPEDKEKMLGIIDRFLNLSKVEKDNFTIGRRLGYFRCLADYKEDQRIDGIREKILNKYTSVDNALIELLTNYI